jgi:hypothetical protein
VVLLMFSGAAPAFELTGFGASTCDAFLKAYRNDPGFEGKYYNWAQGFMSGVNIVAASGGDMKDLTAMTSGDQAQFLRNYCGSHASEKYLDGVLELIKVLPKMSQTVFSGFDFPLQLGEATRFSIHDYQTVHPGLGYGAGYRHSGAISTVFSYDGNAGSPIADDLNSGPVAAQMAEAQSDIRQLQSSGTNIEDRGTFKIADSHGQPRLNCAGYSVKPADAEPKDTYLCLGVAKGKFFKVRTTMPQSPNSEAELRKFIGAWESEIWN